MKKIIGFLFCAVSVQLVNAQQTVRIHGPYKAQAKYVGDASQVFDLNMRITGDSGIVAAIKEAGQPDTLNMSSVVKSKYLITTGKMNDDGKFSINMVADNNTSSSAFTGQKENKDQTITLSGYAKQDEVPHFDSISIKPEMTVLEDSVKNLFKKTFETIGGIQLPHKEFHVGDTAILNMAMPLQLAMINESISVSEIFKLVKVENGLADFDISFVMKFTSLGDENSVIKMNGSGSGAGKCVYDVKDQFFKSTDATMNFNVPFSTNAGGQSMQAEISGKMKMLMNFSYQPNN